MSSGGASESFVIELSAVIVGVTGETPRVLTVRDGQAAPAGPFESNHRTLELGLRDWVEARTHHPLGYIEQLYTFADRNRAVGDDRRIIALSYLALTRETLAGETPPQGAADALWRDWYDYFPWEDRRSSTAMVDDDIAPRLIGWAEAGRDAEMRRMRRQRAALAFGLDQCEWNEEWALQRYELLYESGLIPESLRDRGLDPGSPLPRSGRMMIHDHRRILATGLSRLRAKIKYRPVVFELMGPTFTLLQLQRTVEALAGRRLHKQNFRRLVESQGLVEETGEMLAETGGRPARLVRFRRDVIAQRAVAGTRLALSRSG
jgi:hypothetical protein